MNKKKKYQIERSGLSWWSDWGWSHLQISPPSSSPLLLHRLDSSVLARLSGFEALANESRAPFLSGLGWKREEVRNEKSLGRLWERWGDDDDVSKKKGGDGEVLNKLTAAHLTATQMDYNRLQKFTWCIAKFFPQHFLNPLNTQTLACESLTAEPETVK